MFNFLDHKLMPKVTSDTASTDNYEPSNLISDNCMVRARGYMAYTIIKPPVSLEFEFLCPIKIAHISINSTVGNQRCTGIEVFARNSQNPRFISIGRAVYDTPDVIFSDVYQKKPDGSDNNNLFYFKKDTIGLFSNAEAIRLVIFRTQKSVPCLGAVKVCGFPSRGCSQTTITTINRLMGVSAPKPPSVEESPIVSEKSVQIPEDFKDDLTYEIMAIPMTLPSGKTIDRDTLDKHIESEEKFGRKPCDPFTGLKFSDKCKPVINVALKSRIDMFLLQNSEDPSFYGLKRTIGNVHVVDNDNVKRIKYSNGTSETETNKKCCVCAHTNILYTIPCKHFYCKACLLTLTIFKCGVCQTEFSKNQARRFHN